MSAEGRDGRQGKGLEAWSSLPSVRAYWGGPLPVQQRSVVVSRLPAASGRADQ